MKNLGRLLVPLVLVLTLGCSKKDKEPEPLSCSEALNKSIEATTAFVLNPSKANCEAEKDAKRAYLKSCSESISNGTKRDTEKQIAEPCPN